MSMILACIGGEHKGMVWPILATPWVIGRSGECGIQLSSASVSRRHCHVYLDQERVLLEDLGSRNRALVNGQAAVKCELHVGDEIMLGRDHFMVEEYADVSAVGPMVETPLPQTVNWECIASEEDGLPAERVRPRTVQDLALLYAAVCELSRCTDWDFLIETVRRRLKQYYNADRVWVRVHGCVSEDSSVPASVLDSAEGCSLLEPPALLEDCVSARKAMLERAGASELSRAELLTYAAPVYYDGVLLAQLAVCTRSDRDVHPEGGLQFLILFAQALGPVVYGVFQRNRLRQENEQLRMQTGQSHTIIGKSAVMEGVRQQLQRAANASITVLITGATGVGKELAARALHAQSKRSGGPLVIVNCAAIPRDLFESELFGHAKGAFTGAVASAAGMLLKADGGTLFLDEIGDLSLENQARILRVVENRSFRPLGANVETSVDVRFVAATNQDLEEAVRAGRFREDLFHRLKGIHVPMPTLAEHREDIPLLAEYFRVMYQNLEDRAIRGFTDAAMAALLGRDWPGNVRELRQTVHRAMALAQGDLINEDDLFGVPGDGAQSGLGVNVEAMPSLAETEKQHIEAVLRQCKGNVSQAARHLGISRNTLYAKINMYGIEM